jgi:hypothetical protein
MNLQIPFIRRNVDNRLFVSVLFELKHQSLSDKFEQEMNAAKITFHHFPSIDKKHRVIIHLFKDDFNDHMSKRTTEIFSKYAKSINIQFEADQF